VKLPVSWVGRAFKGEKRHRHGVRVRMNSGEEKPGGAPMSFTARGKLAKGDFGRGVTWKGGIVPGGNTRIYREIRSGFSMKVREGRIKKGNF